MYFSGMLEADSYRCSEMAKKYPVAPASDLFTNS